MYVISYIIVCFLAGADQFDTLLVGNVDYIYIFFMTKLMDNFLHTVITIITADGIIVMFLPFDQNYADLTNIRIILRRIKHSTK